MSVLSGVSLLNWVTLGTAAVAAQGPRLALVIGNSAYRATAPLSNPGNDATDIAKLCLVGQPLEPK